MNKTTLREFSGACKYSDEYEQQRKQQIKEMKEQADKRIQNLRE